ncbi:MAG: hypothetical protein IJN03_01985 [Bacilli bacterium]|nr:hypothetical protein [Bacilli bacterium]
MKKVKEFIINKKEYLLFAAIILICYLYALIAGHYVDFIPINGTFQNFNPVRRFLAGQVPYLQFVDYLGLGHLYLGSIFTFLFGGNYQASLVAFNFISIVSTVLLSYAIGNSIIKNKKQTLLITIGILLFLIISPLILENAIALDNQFVTAFKSAITVGNSARFIRGMILPISVLLFTVLFKKTYNSNNISNKQNIFFLLGTSAISALAFVWSNDYGISVWLCLAILYFLMYLKTNKKFWLAILFTILELIFSVAFIFIYVTILTRGNFVSWLSSTFGTGGYQSWYYNSGKSYYLFDLDISFYRVIQILVSLYYYYLFFRNTKREYTLRYVVPAFVNMTAFCAVNEYRLLSGGSSYEYAIMILVFTLLYEVINLMKKRISKKNAHLLIVILAVIGISWGVSRIQEEVRFITYEKEGEYIEELGGYNKDLGKDLLWTKEFLQDKKVFATYASALETITNQYQPTKYDYIIHVLGDNARNEYLEIFNEGNFDYVATIQRYFSHWEMGWISRANWFFYRELYNSYHPVYGNKYELFWEKNSSEDFKITNEDFNIKVSAEVLSDQEIIVNVETDESVSGYADLYIDYKITKNNRLSSNLLFNKMLHIEALDNLESINYSIGDSNYLRSESKEYIPVKIIDGKGSIKLTSSPKEGTNLIINEIRCNQIFTVLYNYVQVYGLEKNAGNMYILLENNLTNNVATKNAKSIVVKGREIPIIDIKMNEYIYLVLDSSITENELNTLLENNNNILIKK